MPASGTINDGPPSISVLNCRCGTNKHFSAQSHENPIRLESDAERRTSRSSLWNQGYFAAQPGCFDFNHSQNRKKKRKMIKIATVLICVSALFLPGTLHAETISSIAAVVNDDPITTYEVEKEQAVIEKEAEKKAPLKETDSARIHDAALNSIINRKLIAMKIKELDIRVTDEEIKQAIEDVKKQNNITQEALLAALNNQGISYESYKAQLKEQLERLRLVSQEVRAKILVSEKEMQEYYRDHPEKFEKDETFHVRQIFFKIPENASAEDRKRINAKASSVLLEARSGKDFAELAKKYSDDSSAKDGGDIGAFKKGEMLPEFENALLTLKPGEVSEPFTTSAGLHIVQLVERSQGELIPFANVKAEVEDALYKKKSEERFNQWLADLRKGASIDIRQ
jgi:peptidyl-prolyl cis-trans isomerase SurA